MAKSTGRESVLPLHLYDRKTHGAALTYHPSCSRNSKAYQLTFKMNIFNCECITAGFQDTTNKTRYHNGWKGDIKVPTKCRLSRTHRFSLIFQTHPFRVSFISSFWFMYFLSFNVNAREKDGTKRTDATFQFLYRNFVGVLSCIRWKKQSSYKDKFKDITERRTEILGNWNSFLLDYLLFTSASKQCNPYTFVRL